jgi:hypothetical protein
VSIVRGPLIDKHMFKSNHQVDFQEYLGMLAKDKLKAAASARDAMVLKTPRTLQGRPALTLEQAHAKFQSLTVGLSSTGGVHGYGGGGGLLPSLSLPSARSPPGDPSAAGLPAGARPSSPSLASGSSTAAATDGGATASTLSLLGLVKDWEKRKEVVEFLRGRTSDHGSALRSCKQATLLGCASFAHQAPLWYNTSARFTRSCPHATRLRLARPRGVCGFSRMLAARTASAKCSARVARSPKAPKTPKSPNSKVMHKTARDAENRACCSLRSVGLV